MTTLTPNEITKHFFLKKGVLYSRRNGKQAGTIRGSRIVTMVNGTYYDVETLISTMEAVLNETHRNLKLIDPTNQYHTFSGHEARIYAADGLPTYPVHGAVYDEGWRVCTWDIFGRHPLNPDYTLIEGLIPDDDIPEEINNG